MKQIPIYRGLRLGTENMYVQGYYIYSEYTNKHFMTQDLVKSQNHSHTGGYSLAHWFEVDPSTLSIHFPDMLDSQGNKIFASLSEDGKGGDICSPDGIEVYFCVQDGCTFLKNDEWEKEISRVAYNAFKVIGIQQ